MDQTSTPSLTDSVSTQDMLGASPHAGHAGLNEIGKGLLGDSCMVEVPRNARHLPQHRTKA